MELANNHSAWSMGWSRSPFNGRLCRPTLSSAKKRKWDVSQFRQTVRSKSVQIRTLLKSVTYPQGKFKSEHRFSKCYDRISHEIQAVIVGSVQTPIHVAQRPCRDGRATYVIVSRAAAKPFSETVSEARRFRRISV